MSLKTKASKGFFWSLVDNMSNQISQFVIGIILARLLSPAEFGLVGMISVFIAISSVFIYSGFGDDEASNTKASTSEDPIAKKFGNIPSYEIEEIVHPTEVKSNPKIDTQWFKSHFQSHSEIGYRLRWTLGPFYRKFFQGKNKLCPGKRS